MDTQSHSAEQGKEEFSLIRVGSYPDGFSNCEYEIEADKDGILIEIGGSMIDWDWIRNAHLKLFGDTDLDIHRQPETVAQLVFSEPRVHHGLFSATDGQKTIVLCRGDFLSEDSILALDKKFPNILDWKLVNPSIPTPSPA